MFVPGLPWRSRASVQCVVQFTACRQHRLVLRSSFCASKWTYARSGRRAHCRVSAGGTRFRVWTLGVRDWCTQWLQQWLNVASFKSEQLVRGMRAGVIGTPLIIRRVRTTQTTSTRCPLECPRNERRVRLPEDPLPRVSESSRVGDMFENAQGCHVAHVD